MGIPSYNQGYPQDGSSLGQSKTTIRNNLDGTFLTLGVDHINNNGQPGTQPAGYHNVTRWVPKGANPARVPNYGQLYSKTVNGDQQLFWETGVSGAVQQITISGTPVVAPQGTVFLPGGVIIKWGGVAAILPASGSVSFVGSTGANFPNNCFNVQTTALYGPSAPGAGTVSIAVNTLSAGGFNWAARTSEVAKYLGFYWTAIGN